MKASNGYFEIELITENGVEGVKTYKNGVQIGRKKYISYDKNGNPYFKMYTMKFYLNEFIRQDL